MGSGGCCDCGCWITGDDCDLTWDSGDNIGGSCMATFPFGTGSGSDRGIWSGTGSVLGGVKAPC